MTLEQKAGQMTQITLNRLMTGGQLDTLKIASIIGGWKVGSILNVNGEAFDPEEFAEIVREIQIMSADSIGVPCLYGLDMIHGASYFKGATLFPQEINLAATFSPEYAARMGEVTAYETRAGMVPWIFGPVLDLSRDQKWPRVWESYGEDPYLQSVMGAAHTRGIQGEDPDSIGADNVAACIKHYLGYGATRSGQDRTPAYVPWNELREKFFAPFKAAIEAGALSAMVNSASINGIPVHANKMLLTNWLKEGLDWDGMIVTDWADINCLYDREFVARDRKDALRIGIIAGIDMVMDPLDASVAGDIADLAREGLIPMSRINDAVLRILRLKYRLGLFHDPVWDISRYDKYASEEFAASALEAAVESEVLLKNEGGILPLSPDASILVCGPNANSMRTLNGGWSYTWQGSDKEEFVEQYNTVYEALLKKFPKTVLVEGVSYKDEYSDNKEWVVDYRNGFEKAVSAASRADVIVACVGENSYCETPGNINDLTLSENQIDLVRALSSTGKPLVLVLGGGRPRIISSIEPLASAIVDIMLPGNYGGDALALLLSGERNFSGKLPFTYPRYTGRLHTYDYKISECRSTMDGEYNYDASIELQWPFGHGLSYTSFEYSSIDVTPCEFTASDTLTVTVGVKNTGSMTGKESVLVFSSDLVASLIPDVKRLRAFEKVEIAPGETGRAVLRIPASSLAFVGEDEHWHLEEGGFRLSCGNLEKRITCTEGKSWKD